MISDRFYGVVVTILRSNDGLEIRCSELSGELCICPQRQQWKLIRLLRKRTDLNHVPALFSSSGCHRSSSLPAPAIPHPRRAVEHVLPRTGRLRVHHKVPMPLELEPCTAFGVRQ